MLNVIDNICLMPSAPQIDSRELPLQEVLQRERARARMLEDETARRIGMARAEWLLAQVVNPPVPFLAVAEAI